MSFFVANRNHRETEVPGWGSGVTPPGYTAGKQVLEREAAQHRVGFRSSQVGGRACPGGDQSLQGRGVGRPWPGDQMPPREESGTTPGRRPGPAGARSGAYPLRNHVLLGRGGPTQVASLPRQNHQCCRTAPKAPRPVRHNITRSANHLWIF